MKVFKPHPQAEERRRSAVALVKLLLASKRPEMLPKHVGELLTTLLWKITEADGKYKTRFQSRGALECTDSKQLRHDHVYTRKRMVDALLNAGPEACEEIVKHAIGCTVTAREHDLLSTFDDGHDGWERYRKAKVRVTNTETGKQVIEDTD